MLQIKIAVELQRPQLVSLTISIRKDHLSFKQFKSEYAQALYITFS